MWPYAMTFCPGNCSGRGMCQQGSGACLCEVQFSGASCEFKNGPFFNSFAAIFFLICTTSIIQLAFCLRAEFKQLKRASIFKACIPTVQKAVYLAIIGATGSRGLYYVAQEYLPDTWKENLYSSYYPLLMSCFSLIICFWAESFHLVGLPLDRPGFLTKSFFGCFGFNLIVYTSLLAHVVCNLVLEDLTKAHMTEIFHAINAFLMFFVLIFFLVYGVELFCKVHGAFISNLRSKKIDFTQLNMSRLGLIAQAVLQLSTTILLMGDVFGKVYKENLNVEKKNLLEVSFHILEFGLALWFPCVLWKANRPNDLWILNPKKLLSLKSEEQSLVEAGSGPSYNTFASSDDGKLLRECYICRCEEDSVEDPFIQPCNCKGDVSTAHHDCLKEWLLQKSSGAYDDGFCLRCDVCQAPYALQCTTSWIPSGIKVKTWVQSAVVITLMSGVIVIGFFVWHKIETPAKKITICGVLILIEYLLLKIIGFKFTTAYQEAKIRLLRIQDRSEVNDTETFINSSESVLTDSNHITTLPHVLVT